MPGRRKSSTNFVAEKPRQGWALFEESGKWRRTPYPWGAPGDYYPKEYGDWVAVAKPSSWLPPQGTLAGESLLDGGAGLNAAGAGAAGSGGGMKTGAGGHPQPYGWHGYYGETGGGSSSGPVYRGKVTPPYEARGKVTPPVQGGKAAPLSPGGRVGVTTKNDDLKKDDPDPQALHPETREQVQSMLDKGSGAHDVNLNCGYRSGDNGPHGEGRAVDINQVNGQRVSDAMGPNVPAEQREAMRERLKELRAAAWANEEVEAYIDPQGGFFRPIDRESTDKGRRANEKDKYDHRRHIHITVRKAIPTRQ